MGLSIFGLRDQQSKWVHPQALPEDLSGLSFDDDHTGWHAMAESGAAFFKLCPSLADTPIAHYINGPSGYTPDGTYVLGRTGALDGLLVVDLDAAVSTIVFAQADDIVNDRLAGNARDGEMTPSFRHLA